MKGKFSIAGPAFCAGRFATGVMSLFALWIGGLNQSCKPSSRIAPTAAAHSEAEPSAPDVLDLVVVEAGAAAGIVVLEAVVKGAIDSDAELEIVEPGGVALRSGERTKRFSLRRGGPPQREQVQIDAADGRPRTVRAVVRLLGADGRPWLVVERQVQLNQPAAEPGAQRVPVVHLQPDGTRIVEYISQQEARARGLPAEGKSAAAPLRTGTVEAPKK